MTYFCENCQEEHEGWPALTFKAPDFYAQLNEEEKKKAKLSPDLCIIEREGQTDRFIRCVFHQKVNEHCQDLEYGIWVSVNKKNFNDYVVHFDDPNHKGQYFGWLSSWFPEYGEFVWVKMHIAVNNENNQRPKAFVQVVNDPDIPLVRDFFQGISKEAAQARVNRLTGKTN